VARDRREAIEYLLARWTLWGGIVAKGGKDNGKRGMRSGKKSEDSTKCLIAISGKWPLSAHLDDREGGWLRGQLPAFVKRKGNLRRADQSAPKAPSAGLHAFERVARARSGKHKQRKKQKKKKNPTPPPKQPHPPQTKKKNNPATPKKKPT